MNFLIAILTLYLIGWCTADELPAWGYKCEENLCVKIELLPENLETAVSLPVCRAFCGEVPGTLWPKPSGPSKFGPYLVRIDPKKIDLKKPSYENQQKYWAESLSRFKTQISNRVPSQEAIKNGGKPLIVKIKLDGGDVYLNSSTDESYKLSISQGNDGVIAEIKAQNYFGARNGLETLSQLIVYDDIRKEVQIVAEAEVQDAPTYKHRGLLLDTARSYFSKESIKRTIDAMAMVKLNVFHWHVTDSQSFPLIIKSRPELSKYGAYSPHKIYTAQDVAEVVEYGRIRGVLVLPEFDAPAHVGEGWHKYNMTACFRKQPWASFCVEPPCGQLDPTVDGLYDVLEDIYREMLEMFGNPDIFHMGGDEVSVACWNSSESIQHWMQRWMGWNLAEQDFIKLWGYFQERALKRLDKVAGRELPIIMWTSRLTDVPFVEQYLDKKRYIIQVWTTGQDERIQELLKLGYRLILSNYDALYLDCGGPGWVQAGNNWCSPYIGWQKVYMNDYGKIARNYESQVLGAEAAIWSEQIDEFTLDYRFWPRASALAERLWSNPSTSWRDAESRLLVHRERLVENGIAAERLQPEWCLQNEEECPMLK